MKKYEGHIHKFRQKEVLSSFQYKRMPYTIKKELSDTIKKKSNAQDLKSCVVQDTIKKVVLWMLKM